MSEKNRPIFIFNDYPLITTDSIESLVKAERVNPDVFLMGIAYTLTNDFKNLYSEIFQPTEKWLRGNDLIDYRIGFFEAMALLLRKDDLKILQLLKDISIETVQAYDRDIKEGFDIRNFFTHSPFAQEEKDVCNMLDERRIVNGWGEMYTVGFCDAFVPLRKVIMGREIATYMPADRKRLLRKKPHPFDMESADTSIDQQQSE